MSDNTTQGLIRQCKKLADEWDAEIHTHAPDDAAFVRTITDSFRAVLAGAPEANDDKPIERLHTVIYSDAAKKLGVKRTDDAAMDLGKLLAEVSGSIDGLTDRARNAEDTVIRLRHDLRVSPRHDQRCISRTADGKGMCDCITLLRIQKDLLEQQVREMRSANPS